jgi:ketosteroid isomerase-like protein
LSRRDRFFRRDLSPSGRARQQIRERKIFAKNPALLADWKKTPQNGVFWHDDDKMLSRCPTRIGNQLCLADFGQQTNNPDPKLREQFISRFKAFTEALDKSDAAAMAACFTEDASLMTHHGRLSGRQAIEQRYGELFKEVQSSNNLITVDEDSPHTLGTAGNELWGTENWSQTIKGQNGSTEVKGSWSAIDIRDGDDWKIRMLTTNVTSAPAATPSPTAN